MKRKKKRSQRQEGSSGCGVIIVTVEIFLSVSKLQALYITTCSIKVFSHAVHEMPRSKNKHVDVTHSVTPGSDVLDWSMDLIQSNCMLRVYKAMKVHDLYMLNLYNLLNALYTSNSTYWVTLILTPSVEGPQQHWREPLSNLLRNVPQLQTCNLHVAWIIRIGSKPKWPQHARPCLHS